MPPMKGIDRGLNGDALKALEEAGHGQRIAVVDPSYAIPEGARVVPYQGESSATALRGILSLIPLEKDRRSYDVVAMAADENVDDCAASDEFERVAEELGLEIGFNPRHDTSQTMPGFYAEVNHPETLFFRTRDEKAYACATFIVGHSQDLDSAAQAGGRESGETETDAAMYATFTDMRNFMEQNSEFYGPQALGHLWAGVMKRTGMWWNQRPPLSEQEIGR